MPDRSRLARPEAGNHLPNVHRCPRDPARPNAQHDRTASAPGKIALASGIQPSRGIIRHLPLLSTEIWRDRVHRFYRDQDRIQRRLLGRPFGESSDRRKDPGPIWRARRLPLGNSTRSAVWNIESFWGRQAHGHDAPATIETQAYVELRPGPLVGRRHGGEVTRACTTKQRPGSCKYVPDPNC